MEPGEGGFDAYYDATEGRAPRSTLLRALDAFAAENRAGFAVDLGCGTGRDTIELLRRGWAVLAIDSAPEALARLRRRAEIPEGAALVTLPARFEAARWPKADLVNASFVLPLCLPEKFSVLWPRLRASLKPRGRFAGQLYGTRDGWAGDPGMTFFARADVLRLLDGMAIEMFEEEETDAVTPRGRPKHWHIFHAVARAPG